MNVRQIIYTLCVFVFLSCSSKPEKQVEYLNGYWEIVQVKKNNQILREYTINTIVDYFEMTDSITGYRKKVAPTLPTKRYRSAEYEALHPRNAKSAYELSCTTLLPLASLLP